jgi:hypothetical protein
MQLTTAFDLAFEYVQSFHGNPINDKLYCTLDIWFRARGGTDADYECFCRLVHQFMLNRINELLSDAYMNMPEWTGEST